MVLGSQLLVHLACTSSEVVPDDSASRPAADTAPPVDTAPPPDSGDGALAPELHVLIIVHTGEDACAFENQTDTSDPGFLTCRDDLRAMATGMQALGLHADWQLRPGFLELLRTDTSAERYDPVEELPALGHAFGLHQHAECHVAIEGCNAFATWGTSAGSTEPSVEVFQIRADSMVHNAEEGALSWSSFNIWGSAYRLNGELPTGDMTSLDLLLERGLDRLPTADLQRAVWGSACHDGLRVDDDDTWRSASEPVWLTGSSGGRLAFFDLATTKFGDATYDATRTHAGLVENIRCAGERVADPEASGWKGEAFQYVALTHLHNLVEVDGLGDLAALQGLAETEAAKHGLSVVYSTMPALEQRMHEGEARGEGYAWRAP